MRDTGFGMLYADTTLARRVEGAEAENARGCSTGSDGSPAAVLDIAGGCAIFVGAESPLTQAVGLGMNGPVSASQLDRLEQFFRSRGARISIDLCPLADPGLTTALSERGYVV